MESFIYVVLYVSGQVASWLRALFDNLLISIHIDSIELKAEYQL
jgi:hypothetical protein